MNSKVKEICEQDIKIICQFCQRSEVNSLEWGPLYQLSGVTVHYFCLMFSSQHQQNGTDKQGILGFLPKDIKKEIKRGETLKCVFCNLKGATISCCEEQCNTLFHYTCGYENNCNFQFIGMYDAFCEQHRDVHEISLPKAEWNCPICFCDVEEDDPPIYPPCCKKYVVHRRCIMMQAATHGTYHFKCPICENEQVFSVAMRRLGIYVPHRDASWETDRTAFADHAILYSTCDATKCQCPKGRDFDKKPWKIVRCGACAASGIHARCGNLLKLTWKCPTCADILSCNRECKSVIVSDQAVSLSPAIDVTGETNANEMLKVVSTSAHPKLEIFDGRTKINKVVEIRPEKQIVSNCADLTSANEQTKIEIFDGTRGLRLVVDTPNDIVTNSQLNRIKRLRRQVNYESLY